jgi:hypothetical protein
MKRIFILSVALCAFMTGFAQIDTTAKKTDTSGKAAPDTLKIGGMTIIRDADSKEDDNKERKYRGLRINSRKNDKESNLETNWFIMDLGFSNFSDKTVYTSAEAQAFAPGSTEDWFKIRAGKSRNVNVWIVMQKLNMIEHVLNLKYGVGLELNNYFFDDKRIKFNKNPTLVTQSFDAGIKKNKLAADYLTVPLMLNFNFTPKKDKDESFGFSAGVSAGLLYSARQKTKDGGVDKVKGSFDLETFKLSYIAEITLGPVRLYGSLAFKNMFEKGLDITPWNVGFRFSNW